MNSHIILSGARVGLISKNHPPPSLRCVEAPEELSKFTYSGG